MPHCLLFKATPFNICLLSTVESTEKARHNLLLVTKIKYVMGGKVAMSLSDRNTQLSLCLVLQCLSLTVAEYRC